jgi:hypothetical protein
VVKGWKTYLGIAIIGISAALRALGYPELSDLLEAVGLAFGLTGLRAKMERTNPGA